MKKILQKVFTPESKSRSKETGMPSPTSSIEHGIGQSSTTDRTSASAIGVVSAMNQTDSSIAYSDPPARVIRPIHGPTFAELEERGYNPESQSESPPIEPQNDSPVTIAELGAKCQRHFGLLCDELEKANRSELSCVAIEDELGRFRIWASNIGALTTGKASLDYRLRDAEYLHRNVKSLLEDLIESLIEGSFSINAVKLIS